MTPPPRITEESPRLYQRAQAALVLSEQLGDMGRDEAQLRFVAEGGGGSHNGPWRAAIVRRRVAT